MNAFVGSLFKSNADFYIIFFILQCNIKEVEVIIIIIIIIIISLIVR